MTIWEGDKMSGIEITEKLNKIAKKLFPNLQFDFGISYSDSNVFTTYIYATCSLSIDKNEIIHSDILNEFKLENILKKRVKRTLIELKNLIQNDLDKEN